MQNADNAPLAERMRPQSFDDFAGQEHLVGEKGIIRKIIKGGILPSMILYGPPGTGKTTLAKIIAEAAGKPLVQISAIDSGVKRIREIIDQGKEKHLFNRGKQILFLDEIHRLNKGQQDSLLEAVEKGWITLIGATTENPSFEVNGALLSRCQLYILNSLTVQDCEQLVRRAISEDRELRHLPIEIEEMDALYMLSGGDGRKLLNALEVTVGAQADDEVIIINNEKVTDAVQKNIAVYDKSGEQHYDLISAFIKSIRGSDPNAAVYWMARMLEGGEDLMFICRRMIISSAEDVGLANPNALLLAQACMDTVHKIGMPEARIIMSETAIYLASSPKSNSAYMAINEAMSLVNNSASYPVPLHLRNAPTKLMKKLGYGDGYLYAHDFENNTVEQNFLPESIQGKVFYKPQNNQQESKILAFLKTIWKNIYRY